MAGPEELRRLELLRLVGELAADLEVLRTLAAQADAQLSRLESPDCDRAHAAMVAVDLHRYYCGVENLLERIERTVGMLPMQGPSWHRELLWGATRAIGDARPAVLSPASATGLEALLSFRHFFRHAYTVELDPQRLAELVRVLGSIHSGIELELGAFVAHLKNLAEDFER